MPVGYNYNPRGKADPFKPFMETDAEVIKKKAEELQKKKMQVRAEVVNPLQKGDIGKFLLVGISGDVKRRTAIVEDRAAKRHYPIFVGTYIGQNGGKVAEIRADRVIVEESVADDQKKSGNKQGMNRIEMLLHREGDK
jgi:type IV pilus assembly protein PilP